MDRDPSMTPETPTSPSPAETSEPQVAVLGPPPKQPKRVLPLLLLLVVAGVAGYFGWGIWEKRQPSPAVKSIMVCITPGCGFTEARLLQVGETLPARCPKCSKPSVCAGCRCPKCGETTVWNQSRGMAGPTKCPKCGTVIPHEDR